MLQNINDDNIQKEHATWIQQHLPKVVSLENIQDSQYSVLSYPALWSGIRWPFEKKIEVKLNHRLPSVYDIMMKSIKQTQQKYSKKSNEYREIAAFKKDYEKYANLLTQRALLQAINKRLDTLNNSNAKTALQHLLEPDSLLKMQTRFDCLEANREIISLCAELKNSSKPPNQQTIKEVKELSRRLTDCYLKDVKKIGVKAALLSDLSSACSFIGLTTGLLAAGLAIGSFAFPPLLIPATILGAISMVSYGTSIISAAQMLIERFRYKYEPSFKEVIWLSVDITFASLMFVPSFLSPSKMKPLGNKIFSVWTKILSNIFPDIVDTKEIMEDTLTVGSRYTAEGRLKHSETVSSWRKMGSALATEDASVYDKIQNTKNVLAESEKDTALHNRDFALVSRKTGLDPNSFHFVKSYHGFILYWDKEYLTFRNSPEARAIQRAVAAYKQVSFHDQAAREVALIGLLTQCQNYFAVNKDSDKGRLPYVKKLIDYVEKELAGIQKINEENAVLVGFKAR